MRVLVFLTALAFPALSQQIKINPLTGLPDLIGAGSGGVTSVTAGPVGLTCTPTTGAVVCDVDPAIVLINSAAETITGDKTWSGNSIYAPSTAQTISAVTNTINCDATVIQVNPSSTQYVMTSTPTITAGTSGSKCVVYNSGTAPIVLQDQSVLASTGVEAADNVSVVIPGGGTAELYYIGSAWREIVSNQRNIQQLRNFDDFCGKGGSVGDGMYDLGWYRVGSAGEVPAPTALTPCLGYIRTPNTGAVVQMYLESINSDMFFVWRSVVIPARAGASDDWKFGLTSDASTLTPAEGVYFEKSGSDWVGICRTGSASTSTAALVAQATTSKTFQIRRVSSTAVEFSIDGTAATVSSGCPANQVIYPFYNGSNSDSSFQSLRFDWFMFKAPVNR